MSKMKARTIADLVNWAYLNDPALLRTTALPRQLVTS